MFATPHGPEPFRTQQKPSYEGGISVGGEFSNHLQHGYPILPYRADAVRANHADRGSLLNCFPWRRLYIVYMIVAQKELVKDKKEPGLRPVVQHE